MCASDILQYHNPFPYQFLFSSFTREQRLSNLLAYVLITLTPTMRPILRYIPFPVLYGLLIVALFKSFAGTQVFKQLTPMFDGTQAYDSTTIKILDYKDNQGIAMLSFKHIDYF